MIKFVLGLIALVFVGLAIYVYTDKGNKPPKENAVHKTVKQESFSKEKVSVTASKTVQKTEKKVQHTVKKERLEVKVTSGEVNEVFSSEEIGKGITQEDIDNAGSDEEKQRLINDMAYAQSLVKSDVPLPSEEEILKIIEEDLKNKKE